MGKQPRLPFQPRGALRDGGVRAARLLQLRQQPGPLPGQGLAVRGTGGGPPLGLLPLGGTPRVLTLGPVQGLAGGVPVGRRVAGLGVGGTQLGQGPAEFGRVPALRGGLRARAGLPQRVPRAFGLLPGLLGALVVRQRGLLRRTVHVPVPGPGRARMLGRPAHRAGLSRAQPGRQFGGDTAQPALLEVEPVLPRGGGALPGPQQLLPGQPLPPGEHVPLPGGLEAPLGGLDPAAELFGPGGGLLGGLDPPLMRPVGLLPTGQPLVGLLDRLVVGARFPVERGDLGGDGLRPRLPPPRGPQRPELLPHPPLDPPQPCGVGLGECRGHGGLGGRRGHGGLGPLGGLGGLRRRGGPGGRGGVG